MKLEDLQKYNGKTVTIIRHGKHITGKLEIIGNVVKVGTSVMLPGQIESVELQDELKATNNERE